MTATSNEVAKTLGIILDSNAFFTPLQFSINLPEELRGLLRVNFQLVLLSPVRRELEKLAKEGQPEDRKKAAFALKFAERWRPIMVDVESNDPPDNVIVRAAREWNCAVFTNDKELRKRLRDINVPVIYVRQKSKLDIDGRI